MLLFFFLFLRLMFRFRIEGLSCLFKPSSPLSPFTSITSEHIFDRLFLLSLFYQLVLFINELISSFFQITLSSNFDRLLETLNEYHLTFRVFLLKVKWLININLCSALTLFDFLVRRIYFLLILNFTWLHFSIIISFLYFIKHLAINLVALLNIFILFES